MSIENQRMLDLLRVCRSELFVEHQLISEEEYAWLAGLPSAGTHARLKDSDELRADLVNAGRVVAELREQNAEFKRIGQQFQQDAQKHFEQGCLNLQRAEKAEAALERVARCLITPNPGIKDTIWLDPAPKSLGPTLYEFVCGVLGREVLP